MTRQDEIRTLEYLVDLKSKLIPYKTDLTKLRIGGNEDGGYIISEIPGIKYDGVYSYGSDDNIKFEKAIYNMYNVDSYVYDHTIDGITDKPEYIHFFKEGVASCTQPNLDTIDNHIIKNKHEECTNLFMQMDIEGHEFMNTISQSKYLKNFAQIVIEFHFSYNIPFSYYYATLSKLNTHFTCTHVHGNNCLIQPWLDNNLPICIEATYVRNDLINSKVIEPNQLPINGLDCANDMTRPDLKLDWWLFNL